MRRGTQDYGWQTNEQDELTGISLGFDFCAEHEWSMRDIRAAFAVPDKEYPDGIKDRQVQTVPAALRYFQFDWVPHDKRRRATPAAALVYWTHVDELETRGSLQESLQGLELSFWGDPGEKHYDPARHDLACSWDSRSFGIMVRGEANIARLQELHSAFQRRDIVLGGGWAEGFRRCGLTFMLLSRVSAQQQQDVRAADRAYRRLWKAVAATGIEKALRTADKRYYALKPEWYDASKEDELLFFLNPSHQQRYGHGWFTLDELRAWQRDEGPVLRDAQLEAFGKAHIDWERQLLRGLNAAGVGLRVGPRLRWVDAAKTVVGIQVRPTPATATALPAGVYPFTELMAKYAQVQEAA